MSCCMIVFFDVLMNQTDVNAIMIKLIMIDGNLFQNQKKKSFSLFE